MTDAGWTGVPGSFAAGRAVVQDAAAFLLSRFGGRTVAAQAGCAPLADHARRQADALGEERPSRLRVLVLGEFKAGKSSLINALVGRPVAAIDVGELTAAVCRIVPAEGVPEHVVLSSAAGGADLRFSIPEFLAAAKEHGRQARSRRPSPLDGYVRAVLYVRTTLAVEIVDTPGLGATQSNELAAMDALTEADLVLLTVDCDNLGGARDAALVGRLRASGQPLAVAVTKADLLDDDEPEEVLEFVARTYGVPPERLFPVSAKRFAATGTDPGVHSLRDFLTRTAPNRAALRDAALLSQVRDVADEIGAGLATVVAALEDALQDIQDNATGDDAVARVVTQHICDETASLVRQKLLAEAEGILAGRLHNRAGRLTEQELSAVMAQSVQNLDARPFWETLKTRLEGRYQQEWSEGIRRQLAALNANLEQHRKDMKEETSALSDALVREERGRLARKSEAVESAVAAGAAAVTMLALGFPLLLAAVTVAPVAWAYYANKARAEQEPPLEEMQHMARRAVSEWVDEYVREAMADFGSALLRENLAVARKASETYGRGRADFPGTAEEVGELLQAARTHLADVSALTASERLLATPPAR